MNKYIDLPEFLKFLQEMTEFHFNQSLTAKDSSAQLGASAAFMTLRDLIQNNYPETKRFIIEGRSECTPLN